MWYIRSEDRIEGRSEGRNIYKAKNVIASFPFPYDIGCKSAGVYGYTPTGGTLVTLTQLTNTLNANIYQRKSAFREIFNDENISIGSKVELKSISATPL